MNSLQRGIKIGNQQVSMLLYADDVILISHSATSLQMMLDCLHSWCTQWQMCVSERKTQIVHFRKT